MDDKMCHITNGEIMSISYLIQKLNILRTELDEDTDDLYVVLAMRQIDDLIQHLRLLILIKQEQADKIEEIQTALQGK